ncbi:MAG: response regulator [Deltaproteobacteria bacterium]|nr:response regulator [Deltaproteobacteria bacterium]
MADEAAKKGKLGEILVRRGLVKQADVDQGLKAQGTTLLPLGSTLIRMGLADEVVVATALSEQLGVPALHLTASTIAREALLMLPQDVAVRHAVVPVAVEATTLHLAMANPQDSILLDEVAFASGKTPLPFVAPRAVIEETAKSAYAECQNGSAVWRGVRSTHDRPHVEVLDSPPTLNDPGVRTGIEARLPESSLDGFPVLPAPTPRGPATRPRVLAVDDEPEILELIDRSLSSRGMDVVRAERGRQALEVLRAESPDVVLLDAMLPEIHGFEICSQIKRSKHYQHIPVIMISAIYTGWNFIQDVKRIYGADDYITKPFRVVELIRRVEEVLTKSKGRPQSADALEAHQVADRELRAATESLRAGRIDETMEAARRAVDADPFDPRAHFLLGRALQATGRMYESISEYERVVELAPGQFSALKSLAVLYERQGFKAKSVEMWMRAIEASPSDPVRQTIKAHLIELL